MHKQTKPTKTARGVPETPTLTPTNIECKAQDFDVRREHEHDLEEESRRDEEQNESEGQ